MCRRMFTFALLFALVIASAAAFSSVSTRAGRVGPSMLFGSAKKKAAASKKDAPLKKTSTPVTNTHGHMHVYPSPNLTLPNLTLPNHITGRALWLRARGAVPSATTCPERGTRWRLRRQRCRRAPAREEGSSRQSAAVVGALSACPPACAGTGVALSRRRERSVAEPSPPVTCRHLSRAPTPTPQSVHWGRRRRMCWRSTSQGRSPSVVRWTARGPL